MLLGRTYIGACEKMGKVVSKYIFTFALQTFSDVARLKIRLATFFYI